MKMPAFWQCSSLCACGNQAQLEQVEPACRLQGMGHACSYGQCLLQSAEEPDCLSQQLFYGRLSMTCINHHLLTTVVLGRLLPMKFPTLLIPTELPLMKMVASRIGGQRSDYAAFKEKTQKVIDQFDGQDSYGATINGKLTVPENVADLGGIAAALEAAKRTRLFSRRILLQLRSYLAHERSSRIYETLG